MTHSQRVKYIAEGFLEDSCVLLNEFVELNTVEFSEFASLWRKHHFSLLFMGRPDHTETSEFVNEMFRVSSQYLYSSSFHQQVGAVYLLYGLFRNQISEPTIKIRIEMSHWKIIKSLRDDAILHQYRTLHYVIDYLIDNAFLFVACQTLKGPLTGCMPKTSKNDEKLCNLRTTYKTDVTKYCAKSDLFTLRDLQSEYASLMRYIGTTDSFVDTHEEYVEGIKELQDMANPKSQMSENVGGRRAKLKAEAFMRKSKNRFGFIDGAEVEVQEEEDPSYDPDRRLIFNRRQKRIPKEERKVGRPRNRPIKEEDETPEEEEKSSEDEFDITHLLKQQSNFYLPPINYENRKVRTKREPYYRLSPRREESSSDADSLV